MDEQLAAWTRLKIHLIETTQLLERTKARTDDPKVHDEIDRVIKDIEDNMDVVEMVFL
jgi:hypothetical protein